jgi:lathosterol oxidase
MREIAIQNTPVVFALLLFVGAAYFVLFGPTRSFFASRLIQKAARFRPSILLHEISFTVLNLTVVIFLSMMALTWLMSNPAIDVRMHHDAPLTTTIAQFLLYFFTFDLYYYAFHRLLHTKFLYRHVHSYHHKSTRPTPLTSYAVHPIEGLVSFMFTILLFVPLDMSMWAFFAMNGYSVMHSVVIHSGHDFFPRWWYRSRFSRWYVTPLFHDLHHSNSKGVNFGIYTTLWDRMFGTISPSLENSFDEITDTDKSTSTGL